MRKFLILAVLCFSTLALSACQTITDEEFDQTGPKYFIASYTFTPATKKEADVNLAHAITDGFDSFLNQKPTLLWKSNYGLASINAKGQKPDEFDPHTKAGRDEFKRWGANWVLTGKISHEPMRQLSLEILNPSLENDLWSTTLPIEKDVDIAPAIQQLIRQAMGYLDMRLTPRDHAFIERDWLATKDGLNSFGAARKAFKEQRFDQAVTFYEQAAKQEPKVSDIYNNLGWLAYQNNQKDKAAASFNKTISRHEFFFDPHWGLYQSTREDKIWQKLLREHSGHVEVIKELVKKSQKERDIERAVEAFKKMIDLYGTGAYQDYVFIQQLTKLNCLLSKTDKCREIAAREYSITKSLFGEEHLRSYWALETFGYNHLTPKQAEKGLEYMLHVHKFYRDSGYRKDEERVFRSLQQINDNAPQDAKDKMILAHLNMAHTYQEHKEFGKAEVLLQNIVDMTDEKSDKKEVFINLLGENYSKQKRYRKAIETFLRAADISREKQGKKSPQLIHIMENMATAQRLMKDLPKAEFTYKYALSLYAALPKDKWNGVKTHHFPKTLKNLSEVLQEQDKKEEAKRMMDKAIEFETTLNK
ncbi:exported hypothetical protein [Candidatus Terasakiella magnetica]|uniref:Tetratricopeptide repeat protein n=1 Tax=Candidatus Terasakiella magnetica TaxID=1867952 RepID=A0A1C3RJ14_9PROT|nr:tetratricopeptide repeat protein [Candidatus Terasakiella magnetica]SCA57254.1 exported hypothetical protein [Candidatus Terasakiella magnetica]